MRFAGIIYGILMLIFYIAVFIPFILPVLLTMFADWVNNSGNMFVQSFCVARQVLNQSTGRIDLVTECSTFDFRPLVIFLFDFTVYFVVPVALVLYSFLRKR